MSTTYGRKTGVTRRDLIRNAGLTAVAVGVVGCENGSDPPNGSSATTDSVAPPGSDAPGSTDAPTDPPSTDPPSTDPPSPPASPAPSKLTDISKSPETWHQPWVWRPMGDAQLHLSVVENQNDLLFSYGGITPGPTIRMRGDDTLYVKVRNLLGADRGLSTIGENPDPVAPSFPGPEGATIKQMFKGPQPQVVYDGTREDPLVNKIPGELRSDRCVGEHLNGVHSAHVTNLHTHGLHVRSGKNDNQTQSDNIYARILPRSDYAFITQPENEECFRELDQALASMGGELIDGEADFEFAIGRTPTTPVHPPGTHWYHPHSHGSTHNQVASGMAGFLVVEGDVDAAINLQLTDDPGADPDQRRGPWEYRERTMFIQRVFNNPSTDPDADRTNIRPKQGGTTSTRVNGALEPNVIAMRPGAIERWRVLNGSVDGSGYVRFMVFKGRFEVVTCTVEDTTMTTTMFVQVEKDAAGKLVEQTAIENEAAGTVSIGENPVEISTLKQQLWQLSRDGVTLVRETAAGAEYFVKDLSKVNDGKEPAFDSLADCYEGDNLLLCYRRPKEVSLADANRADVFFQAPLLPDGTESQIYTVLAVPSALHDSNGTTGNPDPTVVAHVVVRGSAVPGTPDVNLSALEFPAVPDYLLPIPDQALEITEAERQARPELTGTYRTRVVRYAGWGAAGFPRVDVPSEQVAANPGLNKLIYYEPPVDETGLTIPVTDPETKKVDYKDVSNIARLTASGLDLPTQLISPNTRTMSIDGEKFQPTSTSTPVMWENTAEEWAVYNESVECYAIDVPKEITPELADANALEQVWYTYDQDGDDEKKTATWGRPTAYPLNAADIAAANESRGGDGQPSVLSSTPSATAADHPFHIHQNPFWLMRLDVPNADGKLINILEEPHWGDVTFLPRNGGRAVFRSLFTDFTGEYVNHCHILLHEDNGMMQRVRVLTPPGDPAYDPQSPANYVGSDTVASFEQTPEEVDSTFPRPSLPDMWQRCASFVDANNTGQIFPLDGWVPEVPDVDQRP